ncbi:molybdate ABC transporter substrate-binding protein [Humibacter ginsenosidimutans]|uniref:Molybdate ABC transporter substrate-binding protein n=1 Tax=Humibacter ginsenosidimutans TaxID=2599293 RepID=A0A5B8M1X9_9MICO|nr:molybdate ABC transporter substrate-binding protein [Humibacter ginsenosidimutans]QDZ13929.1 molybdate ABC transporter substrate-binding protein [Humibacter ginsenosidimutans]
MRRILFSAAAVAAAALLLSGCSGSPAASSTATSTATADALSGQLSVSAAASLQGAFDEAIKEFTAEHPNVKVTPNYDGSSTLATQILGGAKVDVFASADQANMQKVTDPGLASDPTIFARNTLVIVVPKDNPANITSLKDLGDAKNKVVLCAPAVPCGAAALTLLSNEGVKVTPVSQEQNVTAVLTKIENDEADAGLVYKTDAKTTDKVKTIVPDGASKVINSYPIVALKDAPNTSAAKAFVAFITGPKGQKILASFGFDKP